MTDRSHGVLQGTPATGMHVHIAAGHGRNLQLGGQPQHRRQPLLIVLATMQLHRQPQPFAKGLLQPSTLLHVIKRVRHPQHQQPRQRLGEVFAQHLILALLRASSGAGDQAAQRLIARQILHQQHQFRAVFDTHFAADDQR
ncbi:hypothetical protein D3C72_544290 [compost metagenome]